MDKKKNYGKEHDLNLKLLIALSRATSAVHKGSTKNMKEKGVTPSQFEVLEALYHKGPMKVCAITEKILTSNGNMTVIIANLEKEGLVRRTADPNDRRASIIKITEPGKDIIEAIFPLHLEYLKESFSRLEDEEKEEIIRLMKKMQGREG